MPEMSLVRFTESDVITSSTYIPKTMSLAQFNDKSRSNGVITFDGTSYSYENRGIYDTFLFNSNYSNYEIETGAGKVSFNDLIRMEGQNPLFGNGPQDGSYTWNESTFVFDYNDHQ